MVKLFTKKAVLGGSELQWMFINGNFHPIILSDAFETKHI